MEIRKSLVKSMTQDKLNDNILKIKISFEKSKRQILEIKATNFGNQSDKSWKSKRQILEMKATNFGNQSDKFCKSKFI